MELWLIIAAALWLIAPAYAANSFPPLMRGHRPIDNGKEWRGKRLLGDGKTIEGLIGGIVFGIFIGAVLLYFQPSIFAIAERELTMTTATTLDTFNKVFPHLTVLMVVLLAIGTHIGDMLGSFIKRRMGLKRGQSAPGMDQLGFVVVAMLLISPFYAFSIEVIIAMLILTPAFHLVGNAIGFVAGLKREPW